MPAEESQGVPVSLASVRGAHGRSTTSMAYGHGLEHVILMIILPSFVPGCYLDVPGDVYIHRMRALAYFGWEQHCPKLVLYAVRGASVGTFDSYCSA